MSKWIMAATVICALSLAGCGTTSPAAHVPTLGYPKPDAANDPSASAVGFGAVKPPTIFNGGDPTGRVSNVTWSSWGKPRATGLGWGYYVPAHSIVADGLAVQARIVAFHLGKCDGHTAYLAVEWFFPSKGQSFSPASYELWCNGLHYVGG
jgi:hypothetical protein